MAMARVARVKSSREPVRTTRASSQGMTRRPTSSISAMKAPTLSAVRPSSSPRLWPDSSPLSPPSGPASAGSTTRASTISRSSTISQPTAMRPRRLSTIWRSSRARSNTTVLATDSDNPNTRPLPSPQPRKWLTPMPIRVAAAICTMAPGMAMRLTASRSLMEKCRPTPNISRMTPISVSSLDSSGSATKPGVKGPAATPASR